MTEQIEIERQESLTLTDIMEHVYKLLKSIAYRLGIPEEVIRKRYMAARNVGRRVYDVEVTPNYVRLTILSTKAKAKGVEHEVKVKRLDGIVDTIRVGTPIEESYHYVTASNYTLKCNCPHALRMAQKADAWLDKLLKRVMRRSNTTMLFSRHVLCKHTIYALSVALEKGVVQINDDLINNLTLSTIALGVSEGVETKKMEEVVLSILKPRRIRSSRPSKPGRRSPRPR